MSSAVIRLCALWLAWVLLVTSSVPVVRAQANADATRAARLFEEARALLVQNEFEPACIKLHASQQLDPQLGTLLHLAHCYEKLGQPARAYRTFRAAAALGAERIAQGADEPRERVARERAESLAAQLAMLELRVVDASDPKLWVTLDSEPIERAHWSAPLPVESGEHVLRAEAPHRRAWEQKFQITAPAHLVIVVPQLDLRAPAQTPISAEEFRVPAVATSSEPTQSLQRVSGYVAIGAGAVGLLLGSVLGVLSNNTLAKLEDDCDLDAGRCSIARGDSAARERIQSLRTDAAAYATGANLGLILGGTAAAAGLLLVLTAPRSSQPEVALGIAPGGLQLTLRGGL